MIKTLQIGNKVENQGATPQGILTAKEFNETIEAINNNTLALNGMKLQVVDSEDDFDAITDKRSDTIYFILENV